VLDDDPFHEVLAQSYFGVIDVIDMRLVSLPYEILDGYLKFEDYVALSYVWGNANPPRLYRRDVECLKRPGSLTSRKKSMPQTLQDAMHLTCMIGLRYLWFDSLCLVQDDMEELQRNIKMMDYIFEGAYVTVVAAAGDGANHGLPGIGSTPRRLPQLIASIKPGLAFLYLRPVDTHLTASLWATRGWTLQEYYLSRRLLIFVNGQVYFKCRSRIWCEETWSFTEPEERFSDEWTRNLDLLLREDFDSRQRSTMSYEYLSNTIETFQARDVRFGGDAVNAVSGILERLCDVMGTYSMEGLLVDIFPWMLIFKRSKRDDSGSRRRSQFPRSERRSEFSTWSWAGWSGPIQFLAMIDQHLNQILYRQEVSECWITWYHSHPRAGLTKIWSPWSARDMTDFDERAESTASEALLARHFPHIHTPSTVPGLPVPYKPYTVLSFHTVTVSLALNRWDGLSLHDDSDTIYALSDREGRPSGHVFVDDGSSLSSDHPHELLLLCKFRGESWQLLENPDLPKAGEGEHHYWAMLVEWTGALYERRGIGLVRQESVDRSFLPGPQWKEIVLG